ncbi:polyketide cyclase / dehydrase and lipid transport domain containing protein [Nitzschia inconspicua]|uniref:Polyketide cyclase / dehydrase and lipid transport domain containing protein n=1 Tax=Nitzschia inconspicua TaxID=303405 RepID=A0A9K3KIK6_9STRA|nr:polyketide cyclase / dehydrase and lipid transport domain containing protein [Nitzschia inconspicua]
MTNSRFSTRFVTVATVLVALVSCQSCQCRKNYDVPHAHQGVLSPYEPGPFQSLELNKGDEKELEAGKPVMKQQQGSDLAGGAICVQDVDAPKAAVWSQILDLDSYKGKVPKVNECKNYAVQQNADGTTTMKTKMVVGVIPGYAYTSFYDHTYHPEKDSLTWRLDYDKSSDFDDVAGHWHLEDHPNKPDCTRVFYACDIKLKGKVPGPVVNFLSKTALKTATSWVKKESESNPTPKRLAFLVEASPAKQ